MLNFIYKEKIAIFILFGILLIVTILIPIFSSKNNTIWNQNILLNEENENTNTTQKSLFYFDPNTIAEDSFLKLDVSTKAIRSMINYRRKGGVFYTKEKIKKMWNLSPEDYQKILPYIQINISSKNKFPQKKYTFININLADSLLWSELPIPQFLISKIIAYKNQLGGFYDINQLKEISYFTIHIFDKIKAYIQCDSSYIIKKNINTTTQENLAQHPYIDYHTATKIADYRYKKVKIKNWNELLKLGIDSADIQLLKIYFYLP